MFFEVFNPPQKSNQPDSKIHSLSSSNHTDGQEHVVADLCSLKTQETIN